MRERFAVRCGIAGALLASLVACSPTAIDRGADARDVMVDASGVDVRAPCGTNCSDVPESAVDARSDGEADAWVAADAAGRDASAPEVLPDFSLPDLNPNSGTHRMDVSPRARRGQITAWYFATAT